MKRLLAIIVLLVMCSSFAIAEEEHVHIEVNPETGYFVMKGYIRCLDYEHDEYIVRDYNTGHEWIFAGIEDWQLGDVVNMIMFNDTEVFEDTSIIDVIFLGDNILK